MAERNLKPVSTFLDDSQEESDRISWLYQLKHVWGLWKKSEGVTKMLHEYFSSLRNPYIGALYIMCNCDDFKQAKPTSLAYTVMEEFSNWLKFNECKCSSILTSDIKLEAFLTVVRQRNMSLVKLVCNIYKMEEEKYVFLDSIRQLIARKQYKEACQIVSVLKLNEHFSIDDFLIPLVFQDKLNVAEEFLAANSNHQKQLAIFLDTLLGKKNIGNEVDVIINKYDIPEAKTGKLCYKPLSKLIARLCNIYNIPLEMCPNLNRKRTEGALQFLIYKRYHEHSLGLESWREMVREAVGSNNHLQRELIISVCGVGDIQEAVFWAKDFGVPIDECPHRVKQCIETDCAESPTQLTSKHSEENWDDEPNPAFHILSLSDKDIILVDTPEVFQQFLNEVSNATMIGIDSEWKPYFGTRRSELALIQIATYSRIFILDTIAMDINQALWEQAGERIFGNEEIIKLGFGINADLNMMSQSLPLLESVFNDRIGFLDLMSLWKRLSKDFEFVFPNTGDASGESLAHLVELCLGRKLDKSDQFSNWERRPLRKSQIRYAALDAFCLLEVFSVLRDNAHKQGIPFEDVCQELMAKKKSPKRASKTRKSRKPEEVPETVKPFTEPVRASVLKVMCDRGLEGLGQQLRKVGVDTVMLTGADHSDFSVRVAQKENRVVVTRGRTGYSRFYRYLPPGYCYAVSAESVYEQLREVLQHFNVIVRQEDIFSRCKLCNSATFVKVSQDIMRQLHEAKHSPPRVPSNRTEDDERDDEAGGFSSGSEACSDEGLTAPALYVASEEGWVGDVNVKHCQTRKGAHIQVNVVPSDCINQLTEFNVCEVCGRVYWDGSHFDRYWNGKLRGIISQC